MRYRYRDGEQFYVENPDDADNVLVVAPAANGEMTVSVDGRTILLNRDQVRLFTGFVSAARRAFVLGPAATSPQPQEKSPSRPSRD